MPHRSHNGAAQRPARYSLGTADRRSSMGMQVGESKGGAMAEMNVVPLIDILLVLLVIFMVITPLPTECMEELAPHPNPNQNENQAQANQSLVVPDLTKRNDQDNNA